MEMQLLEASDEVAPDRHFSSSPTEADMAARMRARARIGCDLLLAQMFKHHKDHAMACLMGIKPHVVDDLEPPVPLGRIAVLPVNLSNVKLTPKFPVILQAVASFYDTTTFNICSGNKTKYVIKARHMVMFIARTMADMSQPEIGRRLGDRDHSTVRNGVERIDKARVDDPRIQDELDVLTMRIKEHTLNNYNAAVSAARQA